MTHQEQEDDVDEGAVLGGGQVASLRETAGGGPQRVNRTDRTRLMRRAERAISSKWGIQVRRDKTVGGETVRAKWSLLMRHD